MSKSSISSESLPKEPTSKRLKADIPSNSDLGAFPNYFTTPGYGTGAPPKCILEQQVQKLSSTLRCKPSWWTKIKNEEIVNRWKSETVEQGLTNEQFEFVMQQLDYLAGQFDGDVRVSSVDGVYESNERISSKIRERLLKGVAILENVPEKDKDWHPGSDNLVLDLVHPSLYCLVNGVSKIVGESDRGKPLKEVMGSGRSICDDEFMKMCPVIGQEAISRSFVSHRFQWLPSDVMVDKNGNARFVSYVNNLHPEDHDELIATIEDVLSCFIPLFDKVLTLMKQPWENVVKVDCDWWDPSEPNYDSEEDDEEQYEQWEETRQLKEQQLPNTFPAPKPFDEPVHLRGRKIQIITKMANIVLTPDKPVYPGGSWHVEGMANEHIVASGIYYYHSENITESKLEFRQAVCEPDYEQGDNEGVRRTYNLHDNDELNQSMGHTICRENKCVCFPNTLQHRVAPFELVNKAEPGVRKILVFFLVDPTKEVWSTAAVPPQQRAWFKKGGTMENLCLPDSILDVIEDHLDFPLTLERAKKYREELMAERKWFVQHHNEDIFERPFSLCEH